MTISLWNIWLQYPLITFISVIILLWLYIYFIYTWKYWIKIKYDDILKKVYKKNSLKYRIFQWWIICILILYSIIFGIPYTTHTNEIIEREWNDIIFVFDVSYSMIAEDIAPTRLDAAREMFVELTKELWNNRLWLVLYAGQAFQSVPLSFDKDFMLQAVQDINIESLPQTRVREFQWTAIGDGLLMARESFDFDDDSREKIIILMTDWEENRWVASRLTIPKMQEDDIKIFTIAFWKDDDAVIELTNPMWFTERLAVWWIDEELLQEIAIATGWEYFKAIDESTIEEIVETISRLSTWVIEVEIIHTHRFIIQEILFILLLLQLWLTAYYFTQNIRY